MIELNDEQRRQLESGRAVEVVDAETSRPYVLLRKDVYERVQRLLYDDSEWTEEELRMLLAHSFEGSGWDEPEMDAYDNYDEERRKQCP
jgi:hypothetical protein